MHVPLTDKHVMHRPRANMRDPPLIATRYATGQTFLVDGGLGLVV